jgi:hypothetical protein
MLVRLMDKGSLVVPFLASPPIDVSRMSEPGRLGLQYTKETLTFEKKVPLPALQNMKRPAPRPCWYGTSYDAD